MRWFFLFFALAQLSNVQAGDKSEISIVGFSADGKYMAYERFGHFDGSGFAYADVFFVDTVNNKFIKGHQSNTAKDEATELDAIRKKTKKASRKKQIQYGISGHFKAITLPYKTIAQNGKQIYQIQTKTQNFRILIQERKLKKECEIAMVPAAIMTVMIEQKDKRKTLQKDIRLPKSRGCAFRYNLHSVHIFKNTIVVFINKYSPGFEGPDIRQLVVTGALD